MLSGDKPAAAAEVAAAVGIAPGDVFADVRPAGKRDVVTSLQAQPAPGGQVRAVL
jgi:Cu+-exporting ATPase